MVRGELPDGTQLHKGGSNTRRAGTDFEFSAPKSFSIQALVMGDERLIEVHRNAVAVARKRIEATTATRITRDGQTEIAFTGSAVLAEFLHTTSRAGDPDLHSHVVALNLTQRADGQWRSVDNTAMFKEQRLMHEIYLSELAVGAKALGYGLSIGKHGNPELAHISREQIEQFSSRGRDIEAKLVERGLTRETAIAAQKAVITLATRSAKQHYDREELMRVWQARAKEVGIDQSTVRETAFQANAQNQSIPTTISTDAREAIDFALAHLGEREAAFSRKEVLTVALREWRGSVRYPDLVRELKQRQSSGQVLASRSAERVTTRAALKIEQRILEIERAGRGSLKPVATNQETARHLSQEKLTVGQAAAVELAATSSNQVVGIQGFAGSGKTTALRTFKTLAEPRGYHLIGLAPSHSAVKALNEAGIEARTLQSWLSEKDGALSDRTIVVVDEAGLVSNRNLLSALERTNKQGARALLVGDTRQYQAVEAGRAFAQLQQHGMATARMTEMLRQRGGRLAEAAKLSVDEPAKALARLEVREISDPAERYRRIASDYAGLDRTARDNTLILTGTNEARIELNRAVRGALKHQGELFGTTANIRVFQRMDLTEAEQKRIDRYHVDDAISFRKAYRSLGVERGELYQVTRVGVDGVSARSDAGKAITFEPFRLSGKGLSLGCVETREVAVGEALRVTDTDRLLDMRNGDRAIVQAVADDRVEVLTSAGERKTLQTNRVVPIDYGYAATGHSAQGLGADRVLLDKDAKARTTDHRSFYTDLTRAKHEAVIYTDDRRTLPQVVVRQSQKSAALDVSEHRGRSQADHQRSTTSQKYVPPKPHQPESSIAKLASPSRI